MQTFPLQLLFAILFAACSATEPATDSGDLPLSERTIAGVSSRYQPGFHALRDAVEAHEDAAARPILNRLEARIRADLQRAEAAGNGTASQTAMQLAENALDLLGGFERILGGRERVGAIELSLIGRVSPVEPSIRLVLSATSSYGAPLALRPGPSTLRVHSAFVNERGRESHGVREEGVPALEEIWVDPRGVTEIELGTFPLGVPSLSIAARTRWSLAMRAGVVVEGEESFPAMWVEVDPLERTVVAPFFPTDPVEPAELARYVQLEDAALAPIMERAVRIPPERSAEALDLLLPIAERSTVEELARMVPAIRWLARTTVPASDPLAWKEWLRARALASAESGARPSGLDIPDR